MKNITIFKSEFDPLFISYLEDKLRDRLFATGADIRFQNEFEYLLAFARNGKRIRPYIAALAFHSTNSDGISDITPVLFSIELFHLFALIHDDIIDNSSLRYGSMSISARFGREQAILWGDLLLSLAYEIVMTSIFPKETRTLFTSMSQETMIGQMLDVAGPENDFSTDVFLDRMVNLKTSRYTFIYPILLGCSLHRVNQSDSGYMSIGTLLGMAFQRLDDLSDVLSSEETLGKKPCGDIEKGRATHLSEYIKNHGQKEIRMRFQEVASRDLTASDVETIRGIAWASGAVEHEKECIIQNLSKASRIVHGLKIKKDHRDMWLSFIDMFFEKVSAI